MTVQEVPCQELVDLMTWDPPVVATLGSLLSVSVGGSWYRGLANGRMNNAFSIYLLDLGKTVIV